MSKVKKIVITGAGGQIGYNLAFHLARGDVFGAHQPISLFLLDLPQVAPSLKGLKMELEDCGFPLLHEIHYGDDPYQMFKGAQVAIFVGAKPRSPGMERKDLIEQNAKIFAVQGKALNEVAQQNVVSLVVGNPCNTNALILSHHCPRLERNRFHAMTRLDQQRAHYQLAAESKCPLTAVTDVTIWGNHSSTQVPDYVNALIKEQSAEKHLDRSWLQNEWTKRIQQRGAEVLAARGLSSVGSAAHAICLALKSLFDPTLEETQFSSAVWSEGNPYSIDEELFFSFPCKRTFLGSYEIIKGKTWDKWMEDKIRETEKELKQERDMVRHLL